MSISTEWADEKIWDGLEDGRGPVELQNARLLAMSCGKRASGKIFFGIACPVSESAVTIQ